MTIDISIFHAAFFEEANEHLTEMERLLLGLDIENPVIEDLNAIFRAAHSIKGGSGIFGFEDITNLTHVLESVLDLLRKEELKPTRAMIDIFLAAGDVINQQIAGHRSGEIVDPKPANTIIETLRQFLLASTQQSEITANLAEQTAIAYSVTTRDAPEISPPAITDDPGYGFFEPLPSAELSNPIPEFFAATDNTLDPGYGFFFDAPGAPVENRENITAAVPAIPEITEEITLTTKKSAVHKIDTAGSIRVSVEKVDQIINLVGELVITQSMLTQVAAQLSPAEMARLQIGLDQLERNTRNLQESVMSIRMMPISVVFNRFPRMVRSLAEKLGKQVELITLGAGTELDKGLTEKLIDPLTHLVRNSLDHGIEAPDIRIAHNKQPLGHITLSAAHQGGNIVITVRDDGAGLDRERILAKARERGLAINDNLSDADVWQFIFAPGFSTSEQVTDISGRGVGMDVVRRNIQEMGGTIEITSIAGIGSTFTVRLPLTLAILDGLSVGVGSETFIIPLSYIIESMRPKSADIYAITGRGQVVQVRGEYLPIIALYELFGIDPLTKNPETGILVLIAAEGRQIALFVDQLISQHQVVIKSLESNFRRVEGISGATIMGDGRVALILDVGYLVRRTIRGA